MARSSPQAIIPPWINTALASGSDFFRMPAALCGACRCPSIALPMCSRARRPRCKTPGSPAPSMRPRSSSDRLTSQPVGAVAREIWNCSCGINRGPSAGRLSRAPTYPATLRAGRPSFPVRRSASTITAWSPPRREISSHVCSRGQQRPRLPKSGQRIRAVQILQTFRASSCRTSGGLSSLLRVAPAQTIRVRSGYLLAVELPQTHESVPRAKEFSPTGRYIPCGPVARSANSRRRTAVTGPDGLI